MKRPHEKPRRSYDLAEVQRLVREDSAQLTKQALLDALRLGITRECVANVLLELKPSDFHKSMTEQISRNEIYMDVYHKNIGDLILYIKFKINNNMILIITSFKER